MVNRVLIRIKVVQILYSYLLTRSEFKIESAPDTTSRDKRYAYTVYINTLLMLLELSGYGVQGASNKSPLPEANANKYLHDNIVARSLFTDDAIRKVILRGNSGIGELDSVLPALFSAIVSSSVYRSYVRTRKRDLATDVRFWTTVLTTIIAPCAELKTLCRRNEEFTVAGYEEGMAMAVATLNDFNDNRRLLTETRNSLDRSLDKAYELYNSLLLLPVALTRLEQQRLDEARENPFATAADLNPNTRFVDNGLVKMLASNRSLADYLESNPISWEDEPLLLRSLLDAIRRSDIYAQYMDAPATDYAADCEFWRSVMKNIILPGDDLAEVLENKSVYWNDDLDIMGTFVIKTIKQFASAGEDNEVRLLPQYKDEEDARFGSELFVASVEHREEYRELIDRFINREQWDTERLAFMDIVVMIVAIAELLNYPLIPVPVTLNEYIEIANSYSTPKSGQFINGILYSVINYLKEEGRLVKTNS